LIVAYDSNYIIRKLVSYGVPYNDAVILTAVGYAESSYYTGNIGDYDYGYSVGIFQINLSAHSSQLQQWTGSNDTNVWISWLSNLDNNIYAASEVYKSQGLSAWTMYNNGQYLKYLGKNYTVVFGRNDGSSGMVNVDLGSSFYGPLQNIKIPKTNYSVVAGTEAYGNLLYGRRYRIWVYDKNGETAIDVSQLRCTFNIVKTIMIQPLWSEVTIYNLAPETENKIIKEGYHVVVEAGYEGNMYGKIFSGNVIQPIREKEGGTTYKLTLVSMSADQFLAYGTVNFSLTRGQNARSIIENIVSQSSIPSQLGSISENLSDSQLTRGKVVFGKAIDYLRQVAQSENATCYIDDGEINILRMDDEPTEIIDLSPSSGLIGVPTQYDYGAKIKCLLNPNIKIGSLVHVDNSLIRNQKYDIGQPVYMLDHDGIYRVIKINHIGDTRGNDWYTELETVTQAGILPSMVSSGNTNPF